MPKGESMCDVCVDGSGWIHFQDPEKPVGVLLFSVPCPECNKDGFRPTPPIIAELYKGQRDAIPENVTEAPI